LPDATVLEAHRGRLLADRPEVALELVADTPWLGVSHGTLAPGGPVPPAHVHREHADCFLVLQGVLRLLLEGRDRTVTHPAWVQVPAGVVHTFMPGAGAGGGVGRVRVLNVHAPSAGYAGFIERLATAAGPDEIYRAREGFDQHDPPEGGGADPDLAVVARLGGSDGEHITNRDGRRVTLIAETTELAVTDSLYGPGERGPDPHVHFHHADAFLVLEGALAYAFDGATLHAPAGTFVIVPPRVVHSFANEGSSDARFVNLHAPSCGFGDHLRGQKPDFDQHPAPEGGGDDPASVSVTRLADLEEAT
jgi:quercetin dioxygenase-like cupin family protein